MLVMLALLVLLHLVCHHKDLYTNNFVSMCMLSHTNLTQFVRELFASADCALTIGEIYEAVEENYPLTAFQREYDEWGERFHHEIRAVIGQLMDNGEIVRVGRGMYRKVRN
jgi:hypothetical protein